MEDPLASKPVILSLASTTRVPNLFPTVEPTQFRLAIVGDCPHGDDEAYGIPFVGGHGRLMDSIISSVGATRAEVFLGNICKYRPPSSDITNFGPDHPKVLEGWTELLAELLSFNPHCVLALGELALHFFAGRKDIESWRGSIVPFTHADNCGQLSCKVVFSIHPSAVLSDYPKWVLLRFDCMRARREAESSTLSLPERNLELDLSAYEICNRLDNWNPGQLLSFDIEGGLDAFTCCSVAGASNNGFIIAWSKFNETDQGRIASSLSRVLYRSDVPKVLQNSLYDRFVLAYGFRMLIRNVVEDTMVKQWEIYPELPKGLGTITSIWTREPNYKHLMIYTDADLKRRIKAGTYDPYEAQRNQHKACILDSCITLEACLAQDQALSGSGRRHYKFNIDLLNALLYMELRGISYDKEAAASELSQTNVALNECATRLSLRAGYDLRGAKGSISSTKLKRCLYSEKGYPEQKKGRGPSAKVSTDVEALLKLHKIKPNDPFLADILYHRKLESTRETLEIATDPDNRVRCAYNLVGTDTGRLTCYTSPTGSGANLQTITKKLRKLYRADPGYHLFQCDLSGADGWTVAAHCLKHGDRTMWDDYMFGLKPALIMALIYQGMATNATSREDLFRLSKAYKQWEADHESEAWIYFVMKVVQHGSNYGMQANTMVKNVMEKSYKMTGKPIYITPAQAESFQRLYLVRYSGLYAWHNWARQQVLSGANLTSASGHERKFFGRRKSWSNRLKQVEADQETWRTFLADEPQENTTYATNLALYRLWYDPENRIVLPQGHDLRIQPLHQVHDAIIGQFRIADTDWAVPKIREYFNNELEIANTKVIIPFEGAYGPSWGEQGTKYGGGDI